MKKRKNKDKDRQSDAATPGDLAGVLVPQGAEESDVKNVHYFLKALKQMSLALDALGYPAEGEALVRVKAEIHDRLFGPEASDDISRLLH